MKKYFKLILICLLFGIRITYVDALEFDITSDYVILYNLNDDEVLYEQNSEEQTQIASLTKIMATIIGIENNANLDEEVTITKESLQGISEYTKVGFKVGDKATVRDLLYGTMLPSGADAVNALAIHTSGSIDNFVNLMNDKVEELGLKKTKFDNPIGMDSNDNYSTASDMASILMYALENTDFKNIFNSREYTISSIDKTIKSTLIGYSKSYGLDVTEINGAKSGFTDGAGLCLASTATIDDVNYLLVTIGAETKNRSNAIRDSLEIYDYYSSNYSYQTVMEKGSILKSLPIKWGKVDSYDIKSLDEVELYLENGIRKNKIKYEYDGIEELNYKIKKGDKLGTITILYRDTELLTYDVYLDEYLEYYHPILYGVIVLCIIVMIISLRCILRRKKRKIKDKKLKIKK